VTDSTRLAVQFVQQENKLGLWLVPQDVVIGNDQEDHARLLSR
jgi:hypothetical protein